MGTQVPPSLSPWIVMPVGAQSLVQLLVVSLCAMGVTQLLGMLLLYLTYTHVLQWCWDGHTGPSWGWVASLQCGHPPLTTWLRHFSRAAAQFPAGSRSSPHLPLREWPCTAGTLRFNHFYSCWDHPGLLVWHYVPLYWGYFTALHL